MNIEFIFIAESGILERQSLLLCKSLRAFGGRYAGADITILQPRHERAINPDVRAQFGALGARIVEMPIVSPCPHYGTSYRVFACARYEDSCRSDRMIFMDSDTVFLAEPDLELHDADVAARPVDVKGMCTSGAGDSNDPYWREFCRVCNVDYDAIPHITAAVDRASVKASYNGGLTVVKTGAGLFKKTADFFLRSFHAGLVPWPDRKSPFVAGYGTVEVEGGRLWGSSQAALSLAITALGLRVRILPSSENFPLHSYRELRREVEDGMFPRISHIHYHHVFRNPPENNPILCDEPGFPPDSVKWLKERAHEFA